MRRCATLFYIALFFLVSTKELQAEKYQYQLAICSVFQNEARFLKEWIEYHKLVGVEHFYLYNNLSSDDYLSVLEPYIQSGEVELKDWAVTSNNTKDWTRVQTEAFEQGIKQAKHKVKWLALLDSDEFIVPVIEDSILPILEEFEEHGGVCINWQMFGTSHVKRIPDDHLMIELLTLQAPFSHRFHKIYKTIMRPERIKKLYCCRYATYISPFKQVDTNGNPSRRGSTKSCLIDKLRINHYWSRDEDNFYEVKVPRHEQWTDFWGGNETKSERRVREYNSVTDETILRFVEPLREVMFPPEEVIPEESELIIEEEIEQVCNEYPMPLFS